MLIYVHHRTYYIIILIQSSDNIKSHFRGSFKVFLFYFFSLVDVQHNEHQDMENMSRNLVTKNKHFRAKIYRQIPMLMFYDEHYGLLLTVFI